MSNQIKISKKTLLSKNDVVVLLALLLLTCLKFLPMLLQQTTIIYPQDGFGLIYPNYYYISESLQNGELESIYFWGNSSDY